MTADVLPFRITTQCSSSTTLGMSLDDARENALQHYYQAERRAGVPADLALQRMEEFEKRLQLVDNEMRAG